MNKKSLKISGSFLVVTVLILCFVYAINNQPIVFGNPYDLDHYDDLVNFESYDKLIDYLRDSFYNSSRDRWNYPYSGMSKGIALPENIVMDGSSAANDVSIDYSKTNIQVEGVDEPDIVKTDGTYLYVVANGSLFVIKAYPPETAEVVSKISYENLTVENIFINANNLILFGSNYRYPSDFGISYHYEYYYWGISKTIIKIFDIKDKDNPILINDIEADGSYFDSRMIEDYVYVILTEYSSDIFNIQDENETINIPKVIINDEEQMILPQNIFFVNNSTKSETMTHIISINLKTNEVKQKSFLISSSQTMYVSKNNIYLTYPHYEYLEEKNLFEIFPSEKYVEITVIHKLSIVDGIIEYINQGVVLGRTLNQFSMDEHNGFFRIATQIDDWWNNKNEKSTSVNILDEKLNRVSEIENIAPGENMHSARFMGNRAYLVTFKNIDPFFVLDLSEPNEPRVLGELKIPGFSDYLHPFDETHIIGIGKDADETIDADKVHSDNSVFYTAILGVKIALFDVSDPENPKEISKVIIGDRGTTTEVLNNHKALLFDKEKELLVLPINLHEFKNNKDYAEFAYQGAYVYKLNPDGFELNGRITHIDPEDFNDSRYYWGYSYSKAIHRSIYIENVLYTISDEMIKLNALEDLSEINSIDLN